MLAVRGSEIKYNQEVLNEGICSKIIVDDSIKSNVTIAISNFLGENNFSDWLLLTRCERIRRTRKTKVRVTEKIMSPWLKVSMI